MIIISIFNYLTILLAYNKYYWILFIGYWINISNT